MTDDNMPEYIGIGEVADMIGLKKATIYVYGSVGRLPEPDLVVNGGATKLWRPETIRAWNNSRRKQ